MSKAACSPHGIHLSTYIYIYIYSRLDHYRDRYVYTHERKNVPTDMCVSIVCSIVHYDDDERHPRGSYNVSFFVYYTKNKNSILQRLASRVRTRIMIFLYIYIYIYIYNVEQWGTLPLNIPSLMPRPLHLSAGEAGTLRHHIHRHMCSPAPKLPSIVSRRRTSF